MSTAFEALAAIPNACQALPTVVTGGQPSAADLERFAAAGGAIVLDTRDPREPRPLDETATLQRLGVGYEVVPIAAGTLTDETLERIRGVLRTAGTRNVLFHCASGNRVGAALVPYLILDQGMDEEDAVVQARRVGLRSPELLEWARDYVRRKRGASDDPPR
ncbi:MAG TPA: sulfur transferase domain-containing protein [Gemmatimonadales bacterium]|jgi:protein tyrosine phosphatase (PTP) superfamily phosphohydrolase (DUF442 family)|nr:sulfur transferase domain-containing protein [Gemmatimonadales bacterium]